MFYVLHPRSVQSLSKPVSDTLLCSTFRIAFSSLAESNRDLTLPFTLNRKELSFAPKTASASSLYAIIHSSTSISSRLSIILASPAHSATVVATALYSKQLLHTFKNMAHLQYYAYPGKGKVNWNIGYKLVKKALGSACSTENIFKIACVYERRMCTIMMYIPSPKDCLSLDICCTVRVQTFN